MDILSHGLWGGVLAGRKNRKDYWAAFSLGLFPDLFAFGIPAVLSIIEAISGNGGGRIFGKPDIASIPEYVFSLYNISHSLIIFSLVFITVWYWRKKPYIPMLAWSFHILLDIFTHSSEFFPTPFLWPISNYKFNGISWGNPWIFLPNVAGLAIAYIIFWYYRKKQLK